MDLGSLIAGSLEPCLRVHLSPDEVVEVNQVAFEARRDELVTLCRSIPNVNDGIGWKLIKPYTSDNGRYAKLLIALGELLGVWKRHPLLSVPAMWNARLHPAVLAGSVADDRAPRIPKPSRGDLEIQTSACSICEGERTRIEAIELDASFELCPQCAQARKRLDEPEMRASVPPPVSRERSATDEQAHSVPPSVRDYLRQFEE